MWTYCVSGNKILNNMGLSVLKETVSAGVYKASDPSQANQFQFRRILYRFAAHVYEGRELTKQDEEHLKKLEKECTYFLSMKAYGSFSYTQILSILTNILKLHMPQVSSLKHFLNLFYRMINSPYQQNKRNKLDNVK